MKFVLIVLTVSGFWSTIQSKELKYFLFKSSAIQLVANEETQTVPALDGNNNISALYNGKTGAVLAFNYETGQGVYLPPGASDKTWKCSHQSLENYFKNLESQKEIFDIGLKKGTIFKSSNITEEISNEMVHILESLSPDYSSSRCEALNTFMEISKLSSSYLRSSMNGFAKVIGDVSGPMRDNFKWVVGFYGGIASFFKEIDGGVSALTKRHILLDFAQMLKEPSGFHVLIYLLEKLSPHIDVFCKTLERCLNSEECFFVLVDKLSGEIDYGFDGFLHVLAEIVKYNYNHSSEEVVKKAILKYYNHLERNNYSVEENWKVSVQDLRKTLSKSNLSAFSCFKNLTTTLNDIHNDRWFQNGVDMTRVSQIISKMKQEDNIDDVIQTVMALVEK